MQGVCAPLESNPKRIRCVSSWLLTRPACLPHASTFPDPTHAQSGLYTTCALCIEAGTLFFLRWQHASSTGAVVTGLLVRVLTHPCTHINVLTHSLMCSHTRTHINVHTRKRFPCLSQ